ncbi:ribosome biogenesis GTPase Der [bacterium]|nr:ribosome biogenesis GTPase Der [bacterium]
MKVVSIIGRTNVGKSTLFNRLIQKRFAVTSQVPKTTRDRLYSEVSWDGEEFIIVDTAGIDLETDEQELPRKELNEEISSQIKLAIDEADLLVFVVDAQTGLIETDKEVANIVRKSGKPVVLACNKADSPKYERNLTEFQTLGFKNTCNVSAISGKQSGNLLDEVVEELRKIKSEGEYKKADLNISILGRPNVGKSTLLNSIFGSKRVLVSDIPGTTIDSVDVFLDYEGQTIKLIDTAGIRRRGKIKTGIEKFSVLRALKSISRSDLVVLVIDSIEGVTKQDLHIAQFILESGKGLILAINKWDAVDKERDVEHYLRELRYKIKFLPWAPVIFTSGLTGKNVDKVLELAITIKHNREHKLSARIMNEVISNAIIKNPPKSKKGKEAKIYFSAQAGINPPEFTIKVNNSALFHFSYIRYLERKIREEFDYMGTPIEINLRSNK